MNRIKAACLAFVFMAAPALANINIELRPTAIAVPVNDTVNVGLYLVSDSGANQTCVAADIIFAWDTARLQFLGCNNAGGAASIFTGLDNHPLNEASPPADGNGHVLLLGQFGAPVTATPGGTLITTLRFRALAVCKSTTVSVIAAQSGYYSRVLGADFPNHNITGTLSSAAIAVTEANGPR